MLTFHSYELLMCNNFHSIINVLLLDVFINCERGNIWVNREINQKLTNYKGDKTSPITVYICISKYLK